MPRYVDGFLVPLPKRNVDTYRRQGAQGRQGLDRARRARGTRVHRRGRSPREGPRRSLAGLDLKRSEVVVFSWIVYKSRAHRDRVNAKVMADPRLADMMDSDAMPFDAERMVYGGFDTLVHLTANDGS